MRSSVESVFRQGGKHALWQIYSGHYTTNVIKISRVLSQM